MERKSESLLQNEEDMEDSREYFPSEQTEPSTDKEPEELKSKEEIKTQIRSLTVLIYLIAASSGALMTTLYPNTNYFENIIKADPSEFVNFKSVSSLPWSFKPIIAYMEDTVRPCGRRVKAWMSVAAIINICCSLGVSIFLPKNWVFTGLFFGITLATVMTDVIAQGLTVILLNLHKALGEAEAIETDPHDSKAIQVASEKGEEYGKRIYGYYTIARFVFRTILTFVGGIYAESINLNVFYIVVACFQTVILLYVLVQFKEPPPPTGEQKTLVQNFKEFKNVITARETLFPIILMIISYLSPSYVDVGPFVLKSKLEWSFKKISLNKLISGVLYFFVMMELIKKAKKLKFSTQMYISLMAIVLRNLFAFSYVIYDDLGQVGMYISQIISTFWENLGIDLILISVVARFSAKCPKGIESFGVTSIAAVLNLANTGGGYLGGITLNAFGITNKDYSNLIYPLLITFVYGQVSMLLGTCLGK